MVALASDMKTWLSGGPDTWPRRLVLGWWLLLGVATVLIIVVPDLKFAFRHDELSYGLSTFSAVTACLVAFAALARYAFQGRRFDLALGAAFGCIAVSRIWFGLILEIGDTSSVKLADAFLYGWITTRFIACVVLFWGLRTTIRIPWRVRHTSAGLVLLLTATLSADIALWRFNHNLPQLLAPEALNALSAQQGTPITLMLHGQTIPAIAIQIALSALWIVLALRLSIATVSKRDVLPTLAIIAAAFAEIQFVFYPTPYHSIITTAEALWLTTYILLVGFLAYRYVDDAWQLQRQYARASSLMLLSQTSVADRDRQSVVAAARRAAQAVAPRATVEVLLDDERPRLPRLPGEMENAFLIEADGTIYGKIVVRSFRKRPPSQESSEFLHTVASQTARLLRAIDLYTELSEGAVREERSQLARELHDGLAQDLAVLRLQIKDVDRELFPYVDRALSEARYAITLLRGQAVASEDFLGALNRQAEELSRRFGCPVIVESTGDIPPLSVTAQMALLRIARESITNAGKHANPGRITLRLCRTARGFLMSVSDDGLGFDTEALLPPGRFGLQGMRERIDALGGHLELMTQTGKGATVSVILPLVEGPLS